jgi:hypothetical protein
LNGLPNNKKRIPHLDRVGTPNCGAVVKDFFDQSWLLQQEKICLIAENKHVMIRSKKKEKQIHP